MIAEPIDLNKTYTLASHNYLIKNGWRRLCGFMDNVLLPDEVMIDNRYSSRISSTGSAASSATTT
jgi:hypothetical protein